MTNQTGSSRSIKRAKIIEYIYKYELLDETLSPVEAFEKNILNGSELKIVENISKNYLKYKSVISKHLKSSWTWERTSPLIRSILIVGACELLFNKKALVINELVSYTKGFIPDEVTFKYINFILDKVANEYEQIKNSKKEA